MEVHPEDERHRRFFGAVRVGVEDSLDLVELLAQEPPNILLAVQHQGVEILALVVVLHPSGDKEEMPQQTLLHQGVLQYLLHMGLLRVVERDRSRREARAMWGYAGT